VTGVENTRAPPIGEVQPGDPRSGDARDSAGAQAAPALEARSASEVHDRRQVEGQLVSADRIASMAMLAAAVAHELNNPLGVTIANLTFALEGLEALVVDLPTSETDGAVEMAARLARTRSRALAIDDALREARQGADRARLIVRDLKTFSRADDQQRTPLDVRHVLESAINMAYGEIRNRGRLVKDYGPVPSVLGNEARLGQVFLNLLVNAAQAIGQGDVERHIVRVVTRADELGRCVVEVSDTGEGIAPEHVARIFEPFFTTKRPGSTGLGLNICHGVVASMGGSIDVESTVGKGSTFRVTLPAARQRAPRATAPARAQRAQDSSPPPPPRFRILVVDDEPMMARAVQRLLDAEHDVVATTDPCSAVEQVRAGARFDAILCDLMMPAMSGMDVYDAIVKLEAEQARRMVFMTGGAFTPRAVRFLERVANPRIEKPLEHEALRAILRAHLANRPAE
jgi:signal transduction histidine kinase/CheY-like chemotaxis protein